MLNQYVNNAIFWIEVQKISPNPYQPRREFDEVTLKSLAESIRAYGVLQPLVVTRKEVFREEGGMSVEYELISGERRLRASKIAGLSQVPVLIRNVEDSAREKLEIAIIENLQREDLNAVERARSFDRLVREFGLKQHQIATKVGKSREYVANTLRILLLPVEIISALEAGQISEGHTRPLLMLTDKPEEQVVLFKEIMSKRLTVREAESASRRVATDRVRKKDKFLDPAILDIERRLNETLGTRVKVNRTNDTGGTVTIDFFSSDDLRGLLDKLAQNNQVSMINDQKPETRNPKPEANSSIEVQNSKELNSDVNQIGTSQAPIDDRSPKEIQKEDNEDLYSLKNFSI
ncbi:MAG: ParB/RepB/Spo0J family partition protein [Patescibacteria group bacterium]